MTLTLPALFRESASRYAAEPFLLDEDLTLSYAQTLELVERCRSYLRSLGVERGTRVAVLLGNHPAFVVLWFALASMGAVMVPVNTALKGRTLRHIVEQSGSRFLFVQTAFRGQLDEALTSAGAAPHTIELAQPDELLTIVRRHEFDRTRETAVAEGDAMLIVYTSGTTSMPKGAVLSHRAYVRAGRDMRDSLQLSSRDRFYLFLPLFHANPQVYGVMSSLWAGSSIALDQRFTASRFWERTQRFQATLFTYVGTVLSLVARSAVPATVGSVRACVGGGAPLSAWKTLESWGVAVKELYGMTELAAFTTINSFEHWRIGTVGRARPCQDVAIVDAAGKPVEDGMAGEIAVRGLEPHVIFEGYYRQQELTQAAFSDGWFRTGDVGRRDPDGFIHFVGRSKEMIRRKGENLSPEHIEELLRECPLVKEAAAVGVPSDLGEDELKLAAVPCNPEITAAQVHAWCSDHLPTFMIPRYYELLDALPKTATAKTERKRLAMVSAQTWDAYEECKR
ncbi:ATP-dependent acyl-CoA ligase [bacterium]|nr:MAG: ATP-dependent acyl-CoA ligase [bacterium]